MFLNIASTDGTAVSTETDPTPRLKEFFAKPSTADATNCFNDFLDDLNLTHAVFPGVISALFLGKILRSDVTGSTGLGFSPFKFPKYHRANDTSYEKRLTLHLSAAAEGKGLTKAQTRETGRQGCFATISSD